MFFFFQAEDGIRYWSVTGVQTCALPIFITSRETAYKIMNLRRDPRASLCVFTDAFHGSGWIQIDGRAEILSLPEAMEPLVDWHRRVKGEHPDWSEYRRTMEKQRRVLLRIVVESAGPDLKG